MSSQYGELQPTSGWDLLAPLGHPSKYQRVSRLGSVTARHSSSRRQPQPNFAALNRGRHLYSAGRPSRWALAHILVLYNLIFNILYRSTKRRIERNDTVVRRPAVPLTCLNIGSRPSDHYFSSVCLSVCLCRVFLSRLWSDFDQTRTYVICLGLVVSRRI